MSDPSTSSGANVAAPVGPITLHRMRDAWPEVLGQLETTSRASWLIASGARVTELAGDVLTLSFQSQSDVAKFKKLNAGAGPSEDLRQAIVAILGIRVKYLAKHDTDNGPAAAPPAPVRQPEPQRPTPTAPGRTLAAAPVTEWAVASIPSDADAPPVDAPEPPTPVAQFAVDDEPEDAAEPARTLVTTIAPPREGDVLPAREVESSLEADDEDDTDLEASTDRPVPPVVAPRLPTAAPGRPVASGGPQRYGEAVVRQVLGATFVREEPYEPPTRFS